LTEILISPTKEELIAATEANFIAYFEGFACLPRIEFYRDPEFTRFLAYGAPGNSILWANLDLTRLDEKIEEIAGYFKSRVNDFMWHVLPSSQPPELRQRLPEHGLKKIEGRPVMTLDLQTLPLELPQIPGFRVELVKDEAMLHEWYVASAEGFEASLEGARPYYDAYACLGFGADSPFLHYTGYLNDEPVTSSTLLLAAGMAGIYDVSTVPSARRQGLGRAITLAPLLEACKRGYRYGLLQSSKEGFRVYQQIGFSELYKEDNYLWLKQ
jgi:GNAT superfamily N-acetyltransferase